MLNKLFFITATGLILASCSEDKMDEINKDVNHPTVVASKFTLTDAITASAFTVTSSDLAFFASVYTEQNVGVYGQMNDAELRTSTSQSSTYNNSWVSIYQNLLNLKNVITNCSAGGNEAGNFQALGMAQILSAYNLAILTDVFGDVPYSEALQPGIIYQPKLDKQQDIYKNIFSLLDAAVINLSNDKAQDVVGSQDFLYNGDNEAWMKFAKGLKARYLMRLSLRNANYAGIIAAADSSFITQNEEANFSKYDGTSAISPFYAFYSDRNYFGASVSFHTKLVDRVDPRDTILFMMNPENTVLEFAPNGNPESNQEKYGISALMSSTTPTTLMGFSELLFLKSEAYLRSNDLVNGKIEFQKALVASFKKVGLSATDANTYFTSIEATYDANPIAELAIQKYISFYQDEALEAYSDYRRLDAMGIKIPLSSSFWFPQRFTYGGSDVTTNPNVRNAYGDGSYVKTEKVWWAGGTR